jgi:curved DNA-binding protein CbpA
MINYYETLGVEPSASTDDIKAAYRTLVKRYHPDVEGGDPVLFTRITEAYEVLSEPKRREQFDQALKQRDRAREVFSRPLRPEGLQPEGPISAEDLGPPLTRVMSMAVPSGGRVLFEGLNGEFSILPTTPDAIWDTTREKFAGEDAAALARRILQLRLSGAREIVRRLKPVPVSFGIRLQGLGKEMWLGGMDEAVGAEALSRGGGAFVDWSVSPVTLAATMPAGIPLYLYDLSGKIDVGDLNSEVVAMLDEKTFLRTGAISGANVNLNGKAKAHLRQLNGSADVMVFGQGQILISGAVRRLRVVTEHEAHVEVIGTVDWLQATIGGRSYLNMKATVNRAHCDVRGGAYAKFAKVLTSVQGSRSGAAGIDILEGPPKKPPMPWRRAR